MSARYAEGTSVPVARSVAEIDATLERYGATDFAYLRQAGHSTVAFVAHGYQVRFVLPMPDPDDTTFARTPTGLRRSLAETRKAYDAEVRRLWRALLLAIKSRLESVASGIEQFEVAFLGHIVVDVSGSTVADQVLPQLERGAQTLAIHRQIGS